MTPKKSAFWKKGAFFSMKTSVEWGRFVFLRTIIRRPFTFEWRDRARGSMQLVKVFHGNAHIVQCLHVSPPGRSGVRNVALLITDGYPTIDAGSTLPQASDLKRRGIDLLTVAVGTNPNMALLNDIASDPDSDFVYRLPDASQIDRTVDQILTYHCQ